MGFSLRGVSVTVNVPTQATAGSPDHDPFGAPVPGTPEAVTVGNVIVDRPSDKDVEQTTRQYGASCDLTLHFPKSYHESLRGCSVTLPAPWSATYEVLGDPQPYDPSLTPGAHDRPVHVRQVVG